MDETNNGADVVDRNQLVGQLYLQPTKTAEFIILDFNVLPTGAVFASPSPNLFSNISGGASTPPTTPTTTTTTTTGAPTTTTTTTTLPPGPYVTAGYVASGYV